MQLPEITTPIHLVIGEATIEVGALAVRTGTLQKGNSGRAAVVPVTGEITFTPDFVEFVAKHGPQQDVVAAETSLSRART